MVFQPQHWSVRLNHPIGRMVCLPGWCRTRDNSLQLRDWELWLVWKGRGWMQTRERRIPLIPGFCAIMRPGGIYDAGLEGDDGLGITYIHFDFIHPKRHHTLFVPSAMMWPEFFQVHDLDYLEAVTRRIVQLCLHAPEPASALLKAVLLDLLQRPSLLFAQEPPTSPHQARVLELIASIHAQPGPLPTIGAMSRKMGMSPAHFSRIFSQVTGESPRDFVVQTRLLRARHLLAETELSIAEIADSLGYKDLFFFSRQFKQKIGIPPSHYRNRKDPGLIHEG